MMDIFAYNYPIQMTLLHFTRLQIKQQTIHQLLQCCKR